MGESGYSLTEAADALSHVDPHGRDTWLRMGMALKTAYGDGAFEAWDAWSAGAANYNARDAKVSWKGFRARGAVGLGTLIYEARAAGWVPLPQDLSPAEQASREQARAERARERRRLDREEAARTEAWQVRIAKLAQQLLDDGVLSGSGRAPYLGCKKVRAYGVHFVRAGALVIVDERAAATRVITGREAVAAWFDSGAGDEEAISFRYLKAGTVAVPMRDAAGALWGWQFIFSGGAKKFIRHARKRGCFHLLGAVSEHAPIALAEGYATAASVREAMGWPVAVCFDAGNMLTIAQALRAAHPDAELICCGDDDHATAGNPGHKYALQAAGEVGGKAVFPRFTEPAGRTDWNDLHLEQGLVAVREQLLAGASLPVRGTQAGGSGEPPPGDPPGGGPPGSEPPWRARLDFNKHGALKLSLHNIVTILDYDHRWSGLFSLDNFSNQIHRRDQSPYRCEPGVLEDVDGSEITAWLGDPCHYGLSAKSGLVLEAVEVLARRRQFHPVLRYLDGLAWDGEERLSHLLSDFFGAAQDDYTVAVGRNWLISAVARVREPGCKVDFMVILEGPQGQGKSSAVRTLCGADWFAEMLESPQNKDFFQILTGRWIVEIPELQAFNKADRNRIKAAISAQEDTYRPSYGRYARQFPRQCIFVGTTNDEAYLKDETGARRFLPVRCGDIEIKALAAVRDQLWAEADARFKRGERFWEFPAQATAEQDARYDVDVWETPISRWINGGCGVDEYPMHYPLPTVERPMKETTVHDVMSYALKIETARQDRAAQMRVGPILKRLGFVKGKQKRMADGSKPYLYQRE